MEQFRVTEQLELRKTLNFSNFNSIVIIIIFFLEGGGNNFLRSTFSVLNFQGKHQLTDKKKEHVLYCFKFN